LRHLPKCPIELKLKDPKLSLKSLLGVCTEITLVDFIFSSAFRLYAVTFSWGIISDRADTHPIDYGMDSVKNFIKLDNMRQK
jgi:hypothetical protein